MRNFLKRFGRSIVGLVVAGAIAKYRNDNRYIAIQPFISAIGKAIRDKWPASATWLPF